MEEVVVKKLFKNLFFFKKWTLKKTLKANSHGSNKHHQSILDHLITNLKCYLVIVGSEWVSLYSNREHISHLAHKLLLSKSWVRLKGVSSEWFKHSDEAVTVNILDLGGL